MITIIVDEQTIASTEKVRILGVLFNSDMNMRAHIAKTAQTCFYHLRHLRQIQRLLGPGARQGYRGWGG